MLVRLDAARGHVLGEQVFDIAPVGVNGEVRRDTDGLQPEEQRGRVREVVRHVVRPVGDEGEAALQEGVRERGDLLIGRGLHAAHAGADAEERGDIERVLRAHLLRDEDAAGPQHARHLRYVHRRVPGEHDIARRIRHGQCTRAPLHKGNTLREGGGCVLPRRRDHRRVGIDADARAESVREG